MEIDKTSLPSDEWKNTSFVMTDKDRLAYALTENKVLEHRLHDAIRRIAFLESLILSDEQKALHPGTWWKLRT